MLAIGGGVVTIAVLQRPSSQHPVSWNLVALYLWNILTLSVPPEISAALPAQGMVQPLSARAPVASIMLSQSMAIDSVNLYASETTSKKGAYNISKGKTKWLNKSMIVGRFGSIMSMGTHISKLNASKLVPITGTIS